MSCMLLCFLLLHNSSTAGWLFMRILLDWIPAFLVGYIQRLLVQRQSLHSTLRWKAQIHIILLLYLHFCEVVIFVSMFFFLCIFFLLISTANIQGIRFILTISLYFITTSSWSYFPSSSSYLASIEISSSIISIIDIFLIVLGSCS